MATTCAMRSEKEKEHAQTEKGEANGELKETSCCAEKQSWSMQAVKPQEQAGKTQSDRSGQRTATEAALERRPPLQGQDQEGRRCSRRMISSARIFKLFFHSSNQLYAWIFLVVWSTSAALSGCLVRGQLV